MFGLVSIHIKEEGFLANLESMLNNKFASWIFIFCNKFMHYFRKCTELDLTENKPL